MDISIFTDKTVIPTHDNLIDSLSNTYEYWKHLRKRIFDFYPEATEEWKHSGKNYGWNFRIKDKKRVIMYFLPRNGYFKVAFIFGEKAFKAVLESQISESIKKELSEATVYAEGRGIRIDVTDDSCIDDINKLIEIKLQY